MIGYLKPGARQRLLLLTLVDLRQQLGVLVNVLHQPRLCFGIVSVRWTAYVPGLKLRPGCSRERTNDEHLNHEGHAMECEQMREWAHTSCCSLWPSTQPSPEQPTRCCRAASSATSCSLTDRTEPSRQLLQVKCNAAQIKPSATVKNSLHTVQF